MNATEQPGPEAAAKARGHALLKARRMNGLELEQHRGYCAVRFEPSLREMAWGDVEKSTNEIVTRLRDLKVNRLLIDLSRMEMIHSGLVASLVRLWKAMDTKDSKDSMVVVVSPNEVVTDVIRSAGLLKLFSIASTREDAAYELGVSPVAQMEQRERRVVAWAALPSAVLAVTALGPLFLHKDQVVQWNAELIACLLAGFACATGILSLITDRAYRRWLGLLAIFIGIGVLAALWFRRYPLNPAPEAETEATEGTSTGVTASDTGSSMSGSGAPSDVIPAGAMRPSSGDPSESATQPDTPPGTTPSPFGAAPMPATTAPPSTAPTTTPTPTPSATVSDGAAENSAAGSQAAPAPAESREP